MSKFTHWRHVNLIDATVEEVEHLRVDSADQLDAGSLGSFTLSQGFFSDHLDEYTKRGA